MRTIESAPAGRALLAPALALAALLALAPAAPAFEKVKVGEKMPEFALKDTAGGEVKTADFAGKARVMIFFKEGPNTANALKRVGRSWNTMKDKNVAYLGVYFGKGKPEEAKALADPEGAAFPILMGTEEFYGAVGVKALPATAFLDKDGTMVHEVDLAPFQLEQEATEYAQVAAQLRVLLLLG